VINVYGRLADFLRTFCGLFADYNEDHCGHMTMSNGIAAGPTR